eukprot:404460_1
MASSHAGSSYNPTVELFLGFDPALVFFCVNDGNGNYVLSTADPTAHPSTATANPSTAKPTGNPSTAEPSTADPTTADPTFAEGQVDEGTSEATQSEESTEFVGSEKE